MLKISVEVHEDSLAYVFHAHPAIAYLTLWGLQARKAHVLIARYYSSPFHMELVATYRDENNKPTFVMGAIQRTPDSEWEYHS